MASTSSSPLSPQIIAAAGGERADVLSMESSFSNPSASSGNLNSLLSSNMIVTSDQSILTAEDGTQYPTIKRHGRQQNGKESRDHRHHQSYSRPHREELKSMSEYALHVLFTSFIAQAEKKINQCITVPLDPEPHIENICGPGLDPEFDQLISALGHISSQKPKPLIDSMMLWRKNKSEAANEARSQFSQHRQFPRRNTEPPPVLPEDPILAGSPLTTAARQEFVAQVERRSTVSIYILCRVLIEIISQSTLANITPEMEEKLEGIIFGQLKIADPDQLSHSPLKLANWVLFGRLLGVMSEINFASVSERFAADLERLQRELINKGPSNRELEGRMELILGGMRYLRMKVHPEDAWDQSCNFMISMGRFFTRSHGHRLKYACCQALEILLLPVAAQADAELNFPKWTEVLGTIGPRVASMLVKPRHWSVAFPLTATLLCASPVDSFTAQWLQLVLPLQPRFKDRYSRPICLQVISRLLWTYLYRVSPDSLSITIKKLEEVIKLILPAGRKTYLTTDPSTVDPLIEIIRIIGFKHQEFCLRTIVFPLINADLFTSGRELKIEQLEPEKIVIGIRAYIAIISDLEKGEQGRPVFPQNYHTPSDKIFAPHLTNPHSKTSSSSDLEVEDDLTSRPILTNVLDEVTTEYHSKFCEILGKITITCDNTFGTQAVLDDKLNSSIPKTPLSDSFNFARRDDHQTSSEYKQSFYELLHIAVQALPRFFSPNIPLGTMINILCGGTAHNQENIAESSVRSLKSIARLSHAQEVATGFARFIFNFDEKYPTLPDGGILGSGHIENTLQLYVELLQIWIEEIKQGLKALISAPYDESITEKSKTDLDFSGIWASIDEIEAHGLFFLCSQSRKVRAFAVNMLRLVKEFDLTLRHDSERVIHILEEDWKNIMSFNGEQLSVAENSRLQRGMRKGNFENAVIELCSIETSYDMTLWLKIFPNLIRICYDRCSFAIKIARELISNRILQMYKTIVALSEVTRGLQYGSFDRYESGNSRVSSKSSSTPPEVLIEQWKLYLIFICITFSDKGGTLKSSPSSAQHLRKGSKSNNGLEKITSARILFKYIIPLLSVSSTSIRDSVVVSLGSINVNMYKTLLEELQGVVSKCNDDAKIRIHQRSTSNPAKNRRTDLLRTEVTHVYRLTAHFLREPVIYQDYWIINNIVNYTKDLKLFLADGEVQANWEFQKLRCYFCGLMEELFEGINYTKNDSKWMTFESRKSSFVLMEDWCGFSPNQNQIYQREDSMRQFIIDNQLHNERSVVTAAMEVEKRNLRTAALSAMAALCGGPLSFTTESRANLQFDIRHMLSWIDTILSAESYRTHLIGRKALKNLITHNQDFPYLLEHSIARCYIAEHSKILESYFEVVTQVFHQYPDYPIPFWRLLAIGLFTLGSEISKIRLQSASLLRALEERQQRISKIQDYNISVSDKTRTVYKLAQCEISDMLSKKYPDVSFFIFSEFTAYFKDLQEVSQRNILAIMIPWIQPIELQVDSNGGLAAHSYAFLCNLCEITIKSSFSLQNELQLLWQALVSGPHSRNLELILGFVISLCLDRREQNFIDYAKQIVVFMSNTPLGLQVIEFLLMQITPKSMVSNDKRELIPPSSDAIKMPYVADLYEILPVGTKSAGFSLGQLSLILLVDLVVSPIQLIAENLPLLLQVITSLWDHYIPTVQDQAREILVHLINEFVLKKIENDNITSTKKTIEDFVESIRCRAPIIFWSYEDNSEMVDESGLNVPLEMKQLTTGIYETFTLTKTDIGENWQKLSLNWATSCTLRHLACRSFQIFRCTFTSLDQSMLADILARLSNTIADENSDHQAFSIEILITLRIVISKLESGELLKFPQLFWTICACLITTNEREFCEVLSMLQELMTRLDLHNSHVRSIIAEVWPTRWEGCFEGLQSLVYKGLRSSKCLEITLKMTNNLIQLPNDSLIGDNTRLMFTILANFPRFLHALDQNSIDGDIAHCAILTAKVAESQGCSTIYRVLNNFAEAKYRSGKELLTHLISGIKEKFLPKCDFKGLIFLMGLLTNCIGWFRLKTMNIISAFIAEIDMRKPEIISQGPDLVSPLLRLLQTEYCMQALELLDKVMIMSGTSLDKQHLRMSMTLSSSSVVRKEFEKTPSLFGLPEDSGWSIPVPAEYVEMTRKNLLAVYYSCQITENMNSGIRLPNVVHEIQFHNDDFQYGYFQVPDKAETVLSDEGRGEGNIGELIMKLDSLDEFFEDSLRSPPDESMAFRKVSETGNSDDNFESCPRLYDEQTLPILHKSLSTASISSSFQNGFSDIKLPKPNTMNPGAFYHASSTRPCLHLRSVTSPSAPASSQINGAAYMSDDDYNEVFSDGDEERHATHVEGSFFLENIIKPLPQGIRSGMRRLTGGRNRDNDRLRENLRNDRKGIPQAPKSPKVPRVPSAYLQKTISPGN